VNIRNHTRAISPFSSHSYVISRWNNSAWFVQTSMVSALIPLSLSETHLIVLMGNFTGNASLRLISSDRLVGGDTETSRHFFSSSFVSSSKGTPLGEPNVFSHDISGGSFTCGASSARRLLCNSQIYANLFLKCKRNSLSFEWIYEFQ